MSDISDTELDNFYADLKNGLSAGQEKLLDAILKIVWEVSASDDTLASGFEGSFKPEEADLILSYGNGDFTIGPRMVSSSLVRLRLIK